MTDKLEPEWLVTLRHNLATQDNRGTAHPVFIVQEKERIYGLDSDYSDDFEWMDDEWNRVDDEQAAKLDAEYDETRLEPGGYTRVLYRDQWVFVTACFTEQGCKDYLAVNGHRLHEPRIYVETAFRNREWQCVVEWLAKGSDGSQR